MVFSQTVVSTRIAPEMCQGQPQHLTHIVADFIQIGSLSAELQTNATTPFISPVETYFQYLPSGDKMGRNMTVVTTPIRRHFVTQKRAFDLLYRHTIYDDSSFSDSRDMNCAPKF